MPLEPIGPMLRKAREGGYAVGYFESWSLESLQGVVDAAESARSPIILGFNGDFLSRPRADPERLELYAALGLAAARSATVPCGLIFNECPRDDWVCRAVDLGFNLVMLADPAAEAADLAERVAAIVRRAHARGVAVEGEVGELPMGAEHAGERTDPAAAAAFVAATGVDLLAVSVGNVHIQLGEPGGLDLDLLEAIERAVPTPLVLHGGTGITREALTAAVARGVAKVNFGTYVKRRFLKAVRLTLAKEVADPHHVLGMGGPDDVLVAGRNAVRDAVLERIDQLGSRGRAARPGAT